MYGNRSFRTSLVLAAVLCAASMARPAGTQTARHVRTVGTVKIRRSARAPWLTVTTKAHRLLYPGNEVQTFERSAATIEYCGALIDLKPRTRVAIPQPSRRRPAKRS